MFKKLTINRKTISFAAMSIVVIGLIIILFLTRVKVLAYEIKCQNAVKGVTVTGTVESRHDVSLGSSVTAKITQLRFREGDYVHKGQILAVLDKTEAFGNLISAKGQLVTAEWQLRNLETEPRPQQAAIAQAQVREAQANVNVLRQQLQRARVQLQDISSQESRYKVLYQQGAISFREYETTSNAKLSARQDVLAAQGQVTSANAGLAQARQNLSLVRAGTKIEQIRAAQGQVETAEGGIISTEGRLENYFLRAPISGFIVQKILDKGEITSPVAPILRLVAPQYIYINAQVDEDELHNVKIGQNAYIIFDAYPTQTFKGRVIEILESVNPITGTFEAKIGISNPKRLPIVVGMTSDITIVLQEIRETIVIPQEFVYTKNHRQYVFKKVQNNAIQTFIEGNDFDNNRFIVTKGLKVGDVIVKGQANKKIKPNAKVKIAEYYKG